MRRPIARARPHGGSPRPGSDQAPFRRIRRKPRLKFEAFLALLDDRGAIAVLCGIDETNYARLLLDELAGAKNHLGTVAWQKGYSPRNMPNMKELSPVHDNIILYSRRMEALPPVSLRLPQEGFLNRDKDPRGPWKAEQKGANKPDCDYEIHICPYRWEILHGTLPPGLWRINPKTGVIWGKPDTPGKWRFIVRVSDREGNVAEKELEIEVNENAALSKKPDIPWLIAQHNVSEKTIGAPKAGSSLRISTELLPKARCWSEYSVCILADGGSPWIGTTRPGKTSTSGKGRYWEFPASTLLARAAEDSVDFKTREDAIPALKSYSDGSDRRLNQTTLWFGRARLVRENDDATDPTSVDYSQDAKKELAALESSRVITRTVSTSKPSKLMARLLALFTASNSTIVDIGSPAAEMASIATAAGRKAIYVAFPPDEELLRSLWLPRLRLASQGKHPLPQGIEFSANERINSNCYIMEGAPKVASESGEVFVVRPGSPFAEVDHSLGCVTVDYARYPSDSGVFLDALASLEGLVPTRQSDVEWFGQSRNERVRALYFPPEQWLERHNIDLVADKYSQFIDQGGRLRVYFHRGCADPDRIGDPRIEMRRIPFSLVVAAGIG